MGRCPPLEDQGDCISVNIVEEIEVPCPYCGEFFAISVDTAQGSYTTTEDCAVCCRPIHFDIECEPGEILAVTPSIG